jgi:hypothetical protein
MSASMKRFRGTRAIAQNFVGDNLEPNYYPFEKEYRHLMGNYVITDFGLFFQGIEYSDAEGLIATGECCFL